MHIPTLTIDSQTVNSTFDAYMCAKQEKCAEIMQCVMHTSAVLDQRRRPWPLQSFTMIVSHHYQLTSYIYSERGKEGAPQWQEMPCHGSTKIGHIVSLGILELMIDM